MKTKLLGMLTIMLGVFLCAGVVSASDTEILQPAGATTFLESLRVGVAGQGGVTFFNGTVLNEGHDPFTVGDDLRVDGEIWRGPKKGMADNMPLKISDSVIPTLTNTNDLGTNKNRWKGFYAQTGDFSKKLVVNGNEVGVTLDQAISGSAPGQALEPGNLISSTWKGYAWMVKDAVMAANATFKKVEGISVTFSPTSLTDGTFKATETFLYPEGDECEYVIDSCNWGEPPFGSGVVEHSIRTGTYKIVGDVMLIKDIKPSKDFNLGGGVNEYLFGTTLTDFITTSTTMKYKAGIASYFLTKE